MLKFDRTPLLPVMLVFLIMFSFCRSTKVAHKQDAGQSQTGAKDICNRVIKLYSEKVKVKGGEEVYFNTEIIIDPSSKVINLTSTPPNQEKVNINSVIESVDCNMNADLTMGQAVYTGYINQADGSTTKAVLKLEVKDGNLIIVNGETGNDNEYVIMVSKWEIVKE